MPAHQIAMYAVTVRLRESAAFDRERAANPKKKVTRANLPDKHQILSDIDGQDFLELMASFVAENLSQDLKDTDRKVNLRMVEAKDAHPEFERALIVRCEYGSYGLGSHLYDDKTKKRTRKDPATIDEIPLHFCVVVPKDRKSGLLMCQKIGHSSPKLDLETAFVEFLGQGFVEDFIFDLRPIVPKAYLDALNKGRAFKVTYRKTHRKVSDFSPGWNLISYGDAYHGDEGGQVPEAIETRSFTVRRSSMIQFENLQEIVHDLILGKETARHVILDDYDDLSIEIPFAGKKKTVRLNNIDNTAWSIDLPPMKMDSEGHPDGDELSKEFFRLAGEIGKDLEWREEDVRTLQSIANSH